MSQQKLLLGRPEKIGSQGLLLVPLFCEYSDPREATVRYTQHGQCLMVCDEKFGSGVMRGCVSRRPRVTRELPGYLLRGGSRAGGRRAVCF